MFALTNITEGRTWGYTHMSRRGTVMSHQDRSNWALFATVEAAEQEMATWSDMQRARFEIVAF